MKAALLRMSPAARQTAVKALRMRFGKAPSVKMKHGLTLDPVENKLTVDEDRATASAAKNDPLLARQEESLPEPAKE